MLMDKYSVFVNLHSALFVMPIISCYIISAEYLELISKKETSISKHKQRGFLLGAKRLSMTVN